MVGLECALRVVHAAMVDTGLLDWADVARVMSRAPARIGRLAGHGTPLAAGAPAELTLYDPSRHPTFSTRPARRRSVNSPYLGRAPARPRRAPTFHAGYADRRRRRGARADEVARSAPTEEAHVDRWIGLSSRSPSWPSPCGSWCARGGAARARRAPLVVPAAVAARHAHARGRGALRRDDARRRAARAPRGAGARLPRRRARSRWRAEGVVAADRRGAATSSRPTASSARRPGELRDRPRGRARRPRRRDVDRDVADADAGAPQSTATSGPGTRATRRASSPPSTTSPPRAPHRGRNRRARPRMTETPSPARRARRARARGRHAATTGAPTAPAARPSARSSSRPA